MIDYTKINSETWDSWADAKSVNTIRNILLHLL